LLFNTSVPVCVDKTGYVYAPVGTAQIFDQFGHHRL